MTMRRKVVAFAVLAILAVIVVGLGVGRDRSEILVRDISSLFGRVIAAQAAPMQQRQWDRLPIIGMRGGLAIHWGVYTGAEDNKSLARAHGFLPMTELATFADYPGAQKENIAATVRKVSDNPWRKPPFFERIVKRNIENYPSQGLYVHDIEIDFEQDASKAWMNDDARATSGSKDLMAYEEAYFREWASWFSLPLKWTKERYPDAKVGLYGVQPFRRDYWGIAGKDAVQIDGTHKNDARLWKFIDPFADFYVASIYVFYAMPDSIYYMAANVEENYLRTRKYGEKPVFAYEWLRYHDSNWRLKGHEVDPFIAEAMAVIPFFSGGRGIVLWGYESGMKQGDGQPYATLPIFMESLQRVAALSEKIGRAKLVIEEPAYVLWKKRQPLVRKLVVGTSECIVMAINPWASDSEQSSAPLKCGDHVFNIDMFGKHTSIYHINGLRLKKY